MPRLKPNGPGRRRQWPDETTFLLRTGSDIFRSGVSEDDLPRAWEDLRGEAMAEHLHHNRNGWPRRPWGWWRFDKAQTPPHVLEPHCAEAARLLEMGELDADEMARLPRLVAVELKVRRSRRGMDPPQHLEAIEALAARLGIDEAKEGE